ncbi:hypothetical protein X962_5985 [Burkholderia pseudomallei MSHR7343]|nr:hypothetical protein X962_5985 [Burkholderia pseudomallei MSHR7343]
MYGAGQQIHLIDIGRIEPRADHRNQALVDVETRERAVGPEVRIAGCQRGSARIEEAATIHDQASLIRDHELGGRAPDFDFAADKTRIVAVDLVDDQTCRVAGLEIRVAADNAAQLSLDVNRGVVENNPGFGYVELVVRVHRHARRAGAVDVHLLKSILCLDHGRGVCAACDNLGIDPYRHHAGRNQYRECNMAQRKRRERQPSRDDARARVAAAATVGRTAILLHHHECAARAIEDNPIAILVHYFEALAARTQDSICARAYRNLEK